MADINEVRQRMMDELEQKIRNDPQLASIRAKIQSGDPNVASQYAVRCGQILSGVACEHINDEIFQNSTVADLASMLVPVIQRENEMVANAAAASQRNMNEDVGIGIRPIRAEFNASQYYNILGKMQTYDSFEEASWLLDEPVIQDSLVIVDESMKENAEFQYRSGLKTCVIREVESDCCDWCAERAGTYYFPDVPDEVWERHNDCRCEIRIETEKEKNDIQLHFGETSVFGRQSDSHETKYPNRISRIFRGLLGFGGEGETMPKTPGQRQIEVAIKEQSDKDFRIKSGLSKEKNSSSVLGDAIIEAHKDLQYFTPESMFELLQNNGYKIEPLSKSDSGFNDKPFLDGGGYITHFGGDGLLQYHPPGGRHGIDYWKIHTGQGGKHHYDTGGNEFIINKDGSITYID